MDGWMVGWLVRYVKPRTWSGILVSGGPIMNGLFRCVGE